MIIARLLRSTERALCRFDGRAVICVLLSVEKKPPNGTKHFSGQYPIQKPDMPNSMISADCTVNCSNHKPENHVNVYCLEVRVKLVTSKVLLVLQIT